MDSETTARIPPDMLAGERVFITGANGLLGQYLVRQLAGATTAEIVATGLQEEPRYIEPIPYRPLDLRRSADIARALRDFGPTVVAHLGGWTQVDRCELDREGAWEVNVRSTEEIAARCREAGARLVYLSTDFVFDGEAGPYAEDAPPRPVSVYGESKLAAERVALSLGPLGSVVRTVLLYGCARRLGRSNIALWVLDSLRAGKSIRVVDDQWRTPTYTGDLARASLHLLAPRHAGIWHVSGREMRSVRDFALDVARAFGLDERLVGRADRSTLEETGRRPPRTGFVIDRAWREIGYRPHSIVDGLARLATDIEAVGDAR